MSQISKSITPQNTVPQQLTPGHNRKFRPVEFAARWSALLGPRLIFGTLVLLALIYLTYLGLDMARGLTFAQAIPQALSQSADYVTHLSRGDLGVTAAGTVAGNTIPIREALPNLVRNSFGLLAVSLLFATVVGVLLGLLAAQRRHSGWSVAIIAASVVGISVPSFFAAPMLQMLLVQWTKYFGEPLLPLGGFGWDKRIILPALVLAARPIAQITRVTFVSLGEVLGHDFIRVAQSKGLRGHTVLTRHIAPNVAIPILTTVGLSLRFSLSSLPVVEYFFGWPGLGFTLLKAIAQQDDKLTVALVLCLGLLLTGVNLVLEIIYHRIDPRLGKTSKYVKMRKKEPLLTRLRDFFTDAIAVLADNPLNNRLKRRNQKIVEPALLQPGNSANRQSSRSTEVSKAISAERRRAVLRGTLGNFPLVVGGIIVLGLILAVIFGPMLAPHSPFTTHGLVIENGEFLVPPFEPGDTYPWGTDVLGRDIMSLILSGAQQTLLLAAVVVLARMVIGATLGLLAGWQNGTWLDRMLLSLAEIIASFPTLLLAMILIVALGIRQGMKPFIIALCFVGWGEVMQFVRSQVMGVRPKLFIESAVSIGLRTPRIIIGHILPNLLPALISIAALEMGAVLILLGELGFIGIFIGGGSLAEVTGIGIYHYSDLPEWGALLSNIRTFARAYAWMAIYPTFAFFMAILGFNLFGEGMRRLIDDVGVQITGLVNRYTVAAAVLMMLGFSWAQQNTGLIVYYRQQANQFNSQNALAHVQQLTDPALGGRALDTPGLELARDYLVEQYKLLGLQTAGQKNGYLYERKRSCQRLNSVPQLTLNGAGPDPLYRQDFAVFPSLFRNFGQAEGQVRFITTGPLNQSPNYNPSVPLALRGHDYSSEILMVLSEQDTLNLMRVPHAGMLVVAQDKEELKRNTTLFTRDPIAGIYGTSRTTGQDTPKLWISKETANRLLHNTGFTVERLTLMADNLVEDQIIELPTPNTASMVVDGTVVEKTITNHVLGLIPGTGGAGEQTGLLNSKIILVTAQYDSPPPDPDGRLRPAANDNASGVAVMLEAIRTMQESGYQPYKTFLFVAYSAQGMEGGEIVTTPDPGKLLQARGGFDNTLEVEAVVHLRGLGAGDGEGLALSTGGSQRLANLFEKAAQQAGVPATRVDEAVNLSVVFDNTALGQRGQEAPQIGFGWAGWKRTAGTPEDTPDTISVDKLEKSGQALSLALMILGRETGY